MPSGPFEAYDPNNVTNYKFNYDAGPVRETDADALVQTTLPKLEETNGWAHCLLSVPVLRFLTTYPGYPSEPIQPKKPAFTVAASKLGGMGIVATQNIAQGDLILSERPLIIMPAAMPSVADTSGLDPDSDEFRRVTMRSAEQLVEDLLERATAEEKKAYKLLHNSHKLDGSGPLMGVLRTNGYSIDGMSEPGKEGAVAAYTGVFLQLSRLNHSCGPNSMRHMHLPSLSMRLYASRDISKGEEITIIYDAVWETTAARRARQIPYGFQCRCPLCTDSAESDRRRARIQKYYLPKHVMPRIAALGTTSALALTRDIEDGLRLFKEEGLEYLYAYPMFLWYVCAVLNALGQDEARFRKYALLLIKFWIMSGTNVGKMMERFKEFIVPLHGVRRNL